MKIIYLIAFAISFTGCSISKYSNSTNRNNSNKNDSKPAVATSDMLLFPVAGSKTSIGSFWGDARDGGRRKHEGIDIFARKGTEVVAICDGVIIARNNDGIGGKTLWLLSEDYEWQVYYAHLDSQYAYDGQKVSKGDIIGSVGNTGNAKFTPSHLHFGIYTSLGAIDPLPFIKTAPKLASTVVLAEDTHKKPVKKTNTKPKIFSSKKA